MQQSVLQIFAPHLAKMFDTAQYCPKNERYLHVYTKHTGGYLHLWRQMQIYETSFLCSKWNHDSVGGLQGTDFTVHEPHPFEYSCMLITRGAAKACLSCPIEIECTMIRAWAAIKR